MDKKISMMIKLLIFLGNLVFLLLIFILFLDQKIIFEALLALLFMQSLFCGIALFLYSMYKKFQKLARQFNFKYLRGSFPHPKFEGYFKKNWWQLHFVSKEEGEQWGVPRTYIKLQFKKPKKFDEKILKNYRNIVYKGHRVMEIKYIDRDYKSYLLLKRTWFIFEKTKIIQLMELLLKVADEAKIK